jgi:hypothetical protein
MRTVVEKRGMILFPLLRHPVSQKLLRFLWRFVRLIGIFFG